MMVQILWFFSVIQVLFGTIQKLSFLNSLLVIVISLGGALVGQLAQSRQKLVLQILLLLLFTRTLHLQEIWVLALLPQQLVLM